MALRDNWDPQGGQILRGPIQSAMDDVEAAALYATVAEAEAGNPLIDFLRTAGHAVTGTGGALYKLAAANPSHAFKLEAANGRYYEVAEPFITPQMAGARPQDNVDATDAINACIEACNGGDYGNIHFPKEFYVADGDIIPITRSDIIVTSAGAELRKSSTAGTSGNFWRIGDPAGAVTARTTIGGFKYTCQNQENFSTAAEPVFILDNASDTFLPDADFGNVAGMILCGDTVNCPRPVLLNWKGNWEGPSVVNAYRFRRTTELAMLNVRTRSPEADALAAVLFDAQQSMDTIYMNFCAIFANNGVEYGWDFNMTNGSITNAWTDFCTIDAALQAALRVRAFGDDLTQSRNWKHRGLWTRTTNGPAILYENGGSQAIIEDHKYRDSTHGFAGPRAVVVRPPTNGGTTRTIKFHGEGFKDDVVNIDSIALTNPVRVTFNKEHGIPDGTTVKLLGITSPSELDDITAVTSNSDDLSLDLTGVDGTGLAAYTGGGGVTQLATNGVILLGAPGCEVVMCSFEARSAIAEEDGVNAIELTDGAINDVFIMGNNLHGVINLIKDEASLPFSMDRTVIGNTAGTNEIGPTRVRTGDSGGTAPSFADDFVVESDGNTGITILSPSNQSCRISFGDADAANPAFVAYNHTTNEMEFGAAGGARMRIKSDGIYYVDGGGVEEKLNTT